MDAVPPNSKMHSGIAREQPAQTLREGNTRVERLNHEAHQAIQQECIQIDANGGDERAVYSCC